MGKKIKTKMFNEIQIMDQDKIIDLIKEYQKTKNNDVLTKILEQNYQFVAKQAKKYYRSEDILIDYDDLVQQGLMGIMVAAERFDVEKDYRFLTYAGWYVQLYITRFMYGNTTDLNYPLNFVMQSKRYSQYLANLSDEEKSQLKLEDISKKLNIPITVLKYLNSNPMTTIRLDKEVNSSEGECNTYGELFLTTNDDDDPCNEVSRNDLRDYLLDFMNKNLSEKEKEVLLLRYGFNGEPLTLEAIGQMYGCTRERIRQIEVKAKRKIKLKLYRDIKTKDMDINELFYGGI